jgi:hypothetical protein
MRLNAPAPRGNHGSTVLGGGIWQRQTPFPGKWWELFDGGLMPETGRLSAEAVVAGGIESWPQRPQNKKPPAGHCRWFLEVSHKVGVVS